MIINKVLKNFSIIAFQMLIMRRMINDILGNQNDNIFAFIFSLQILIKLIKECLNINRGTIDMIKLEYNF